MSHEVVSNRREAVQAEDSRSGDGEPDERHASVKSMATSEESLGLEAVPGWQPPGPKLEPEAGARSLPDAGSMLDMLDELDGKPHELRHEALIGSDDRIKIRETAHFPWRPICSLRIRTGDGDYFSGTGWLAGPRTIITAGHCVYLPTMGGWAKEIEIVPGHDAHERPFGTLVSTEFQTVRGWIQDLDRQFDYAAITLPPGRDLEEVGHFGFAVYDEASLLGAYLNVAGYPTDKPLGTLWWAARKAKRVKRGAIYYDIDTTGGQSGAPVWRLDAQGRRLVVGIHTNGARTGNSATRITEDVFANLKRWIDEAREPTQVIQQSSAPYRPFP